MPSPSATRPRTWPARSSGDGSTGKRCSGRSGCSGGWSTPAGRCKGRRGAGGRRARAGTARPGNGAAAGAAVPADARRRPDAAREGGGRAEGAPERDREARRDPPPRRAAGPAPGAGRGDPAADLGAITAAHPGGAAAGHRILPPAGGRGAVRRVLLGVTAMLAAARGVAAQDGQARALELERKGEYAAAAAAWRGILAERPGDFPALVGLERALTPLGRLSEMIGDLRGALRRDSSPGVLGVAVRVWTAARQPDSARAAVERWNKAEPESEAPFQEWGMAAFAARDRASAKAAYLLGRQRLGKPDVLAAELGQVAGDESDYPDR